MPKRIFKDYSGWRICAHSKDARYIINNLGKFEFNWVIYERDLCFEFIDEGFKFFEL